MSDVLTIHKERVPWIDNLRFFAIFMVVFHHFSYIINSGGVGMKELNLYIVSFNMYLFAFVSGITTYRGLSKIKTLKDLFSYITKTAWHIGVPTVVYSIPFYIYLYVEQGNYNTALKFFILLTAFCVFVYLFKYKIQNQWFRSVFPLVTFPFCLYFQCVWYFVYIYTILLCSAICFYISQQIGKMKPIVFVVLFLALSFVVADIVPFKSSIEFFLPYIVGLVYYRFYGYMNVTENRIHTVIISVLLVAIGTVLFSLYYGIGEFYFNDFFQLWRDNNLIVFLERQVCAICLIGGSCLITQMCFRNYNKISMLGAITLALYPIHSDIITIAKNYLYLDFNNFIGNFVVTLLFTIVLIVLVGVIILQITKSRYVKLLLLGQ